MFLRHAVLRERTAIAMLSVSPSPTASQPFVLPSRPPPTSVNDVLDEYALDVSVLLAGCEGGWVVGTVKKKYRGRKTTTNLNYWVQYDDGEWSHALTAASYEGRGGAVGSWFIFAENQNYY